MTTVDQAKEIIGQETIPHNSRIAHGDMREGRYDETVPGGLYIVSTGYVRGITQHKVVDANNNDFGTVPQSPEEIIARAQAHADQLGAEKAELVMRLAAQENQTNQAIAQAKAADAAVAAATARAAKAEAALAAVKQ